VTSPCHSHHLHRVYRALNAYPSTCLLSCLISVFSCSYRKLYPLDHANLLHSCVLLNTELVQKVCSPSSLACCSCCLSSSSPCSHSLHLNVAIGMSIVKSPKKPGALGPLCGSPLMAFQNFLVLLPLVFFLLDSCPLSSYELS
jgi:hypothetical protein